MSDEDEAALRVGIRVSRLKGARLEPGDAEAATALARVLASVEPLSNENERLRAMYEHERKQPKARAVSFPSFEIQFERDRRGRIANTRAEALRGTEVMTLVPQGGLPPVNLMFTRDRRGRIASPVRFDPIPEA